MGLLSDFEGYQKKRSKTDPLASPAASTQSMTSNDKLRAALPDLIPHKDRELVRLLYAARHAQRYPATDTKRGWPGKWKCEDLLGVAARLGEILDRETSSRISSPSFVVHYLRLLYFPAGPLRMLVVVQLRERR